MSDFWIILSALLVIGSSAFIGPFLMFQQKAMISDAISHAILPGIVVGYLISGTRHIAVVLTAAILTGLLTVWLIELLGKKGKQPNDASIGVVFTTLFAIGVILISQFTHQVDLDLDCVLYGDLALLPFDTLSIGIPRQTLNLLVSSIFVITTVIIFYRRYFITSFDESFAQSAGWKTGFWKYILMFTLSFHTVIAFESVGAVLVIAFLMIPAASAYLFQKTLPQIIFAALIIGGTAVVTGYYLAKGLNISITGSMTVVSGLFFTVVLCFYLYNKRKQATTLLKDPKVQ